MPPTTMENQERFVESHSIWAEPLSLTVIVTDGKQRPWVGTPSWKHSWEQRLSSVGVQSAPGGTLQTGSKKLKWKMRLPDVHFKQLAKTRCQHMVLGMANTAKSDPPWTTPLYNPLSLSLSSTCDLHLTNRICDKWRDITPLITLHYVSQAVMPVIMLCFTYKALSPQTRERGSLLALKKYTAILWGHVVGSLSEPHGILQPTASQQNGRWILPTIRGSMWADLAPVRRPVTPVVQPSQLW